MHEALWLRKRLKHETFTSSLLRLRRNGINAYLETPLKRKNLRYPKRVFFHPQLGGTLRFLSLRFSWRIITFLFMPWPSIGRSLGSTWWITCTVAFMGTFGPPMVLKRSKEKLRQKSSFNFITRGKFHEKPKMKDFKDLLLFSPSPRKTKSVSGIILSAFFQARPRLRRWGRHAWEKKDSCLQRL